MMPMYNQAMPGMPYRQAAPTYSQSPKFPQMAPWQTPSAPKMPSPANLVAGNYSAPLPPPTLSRGVSGTGLPKFEMPSPHALGIATNLRQPTLPATVVPPQQPQVDWNQIQIRIERLGVRRYEKGRTPTGEIRVLLELPTTDPMRNHPVHAQGETEAVAVTRALQQAEALMTRTE
ncbi:MAG: hypothetical protein EXS16_10530 [Gemmataceae bacterium]|nr:hypothetical protein [Gemmataceae bacterium]